MSAPVLFALDRNNGRERLTVRMTTWGGSPKDEAVEIAIERRSSSGWVRGPYLVISPAEIFLLHDALGCACNRVLGRTP